MPPFGRRTTEPTPVPEPHAFDQISKRTIEEAEDGSNILTALAQFLESAGASPGYVARVRDSAKAITEVTERHPHAMPPYARRNNITAQSDHESVFRSRLAQKLYPVEEHTGALKETWTVADHSSWQQDLAGRIYDSDGVILAESLDDLESIMRQLGWFVPSSAATAGVIWSAMPSGERESERRANTVRSKARELGY